MQDVNVTDLHKEGNIMLCPLCPAFGVCVLLWFRFTCCANTSYSEVGLSEGAELWGAVLACGAFDDLVTECAVRRWTCSEWGLAASWLHRVSPRHLPAPQKLLLLCPSLGKVTDPRKEGQVCV